MHEVDELGILSVIDTVDLTAQSILWTQYRFARPIGQSNSQVSPSSVGFIRRSKADGCDFTDGSHGMDSKGFAVVYEDPIVLVEPSQDNENPTNGDQSQYQADAGVE
jgi:hypothetical protein